MPMNNHAVCIVGVPRSGTSLIAHAARLAGVYLGRDDALAPAVSNINDDGFFELEELFVLHQSILMAAGQRGWYSSEPLPEQWWKSRAVAPGREALSRLVVREFSGTSLWGWKSPPATILLPLWEDLARELGFSMRLIVVFRNPLDVARSLARVWNLPVAQGLRLWTYYTLMIFNEVEKYPHLFIQYGGFLANQELHTRRLADFLGCEDPDLQQKIKEIVRPDLRHSWASMEDLMAVADADVVALFQKCLDRMNGVDHPDHSRSLPLIRSMADYEEWSRLTDFRCSDSFPVCLDSAVVFDPGENSQVVAKIIPYAPDGTFDEEYRLPRPGAATVLFRPHPGGGKCLFRCRINAVETDGLSQGIEDKNPEREEDGWDLFLPDSQPFYKLAGDFSKATYVRIKGKIEIAAFVP